MEYGVSMLLGLCGFGYWVQSFRCFPWLVLNFQQVHALHLSPATLQLVHNIGNLPMVVKPLFGVISDAVYIGDAHRLPYISIGVDGSAGRAFHLLPHATWIPIEGETFPTQIACILLGNLGASFADVFNDALAAELGRIRKSAQLQSYAFIALAAGAMSGNLSGGFILLRTQEPKILFLIFDLLLFVQLAISLSAKETPLCIPKSSKRQFARSSLLENLGNQFTDLVTAINDETIVRPLWWIVASVAVVPILSGSMFCFQMQYLNINPSVIGLSKVIGQLVVLSITLFYERCLKRIPMRRLVFGVQTLYALSLLSDLVLVKQWNTKLGMSNEVWVLCLSALAEAIAQFKILPFSVLFLRLCPSGCEGSLLAFFASAMCLSSILSGLSGVGLASLISVSSEDYSGLPVGILAQFIAALVPLGWISCMPFPFTRNLEDARMGKRR